MKKSCALGVISILVTSIAFAAEVAHFGYSGDHGPDKWSTLSPAFSACMAGVKQSPVNLVATRDEELPKLDIGYSTLATDFVNNGHAVQANYAAGSALTDDDHEDAPYKARVDYAPGSTIGHLDGSYELKQFHFHSPSEHQLNGKNLPAEIHFVHADAKGNLAVIGVLVESGAANPVIANLWQKIPETEGQSIALNSPVNAADLLPKDRDYFYYDGSLTTPPCSEGVRWLVMKQPITLSGEQIAALKKAIGFDNNRPVQPLNGRDVSE